MTRTYVISGSASGVGAATLKTLKAAGHIVIGVDLTNADVEVDLSTVAGRREGVAKAISLSEGKIDAVIACAGIALPIAQTVSVNYFGVTEFLSALLPTLSKSTSPRVAVTSCMASLLPNSVELVAAMRADDERKALEIAQGLVDAGGGGELLIYGSTKRALSCWVRRECIKSQWAGAGIPLNAVGPGIVKTPMVADLIATPESTAGILEMVHTLSLLGLVEPEAVAYLLIWLTSPENTRTTGQTIYIDGGSDAALRGEDIWDLGKQPQN